MGNSTPWVSGVAPGISADRLNEPFWIQSATYQASPSQINLVIGAGRADFSVPGQDASSVVSNTSTSAVTISNPNTNTTYWVFINSTGAFRTSTSPVLLAHEIRLGSVTTGVSLSSITVVDYRGLIAAPGGTMQKLGSWVGDSTTAQASFSNIPQNFTHLLFISSIRTLNTSGCSVGSNGNVYAQFQNDSSGGHYGNVTIDSATPGGPDNLARVFTAQLYSSAAWFLPTIWCWSEPAAGMALLPNYSSPASGFKSGFTMAGFSTVGGAVNYVRIRAWSYWVTTGITAVFLRTDDGFAIDGISRVDMYGIA